MKWVFVAGNFVLALKKADAELAGKEFSMGLAEKPENAKQTVVHRTEPCRTSQATAGRRPRQGHSVHHAVDFTLGDGTVSPTIGRTSNSSTSAPPRRNTLRRRSAVYIDEVKKRRPAARRLRRSTTASSACSKIRALKTGRRTSLPQLKRLKDAGVEVYIGGGRRRGGDGRSTAARIGSRTALRRAARCSTLWAAPRYRYLQALYMAAKK